METKHICMISIYVFVLLGCLITMLAMYLVLEIRWKILKFLKNIELDFCCMRQRCESFSDVIAVSKHYWETTSCSRQVKQNLYPLGVSGLLS